MNNIYQKPDSDLVSSNKTAADYPLYKITGIGLASFFGSSLAGGYLASKNLKALGREEEAKKVLLMSLAITVAIIVAIFIISEFIDIPSSSLSVVHVVIMVQLSKKWFASELQNHIDDGGETYSNWRAFGLSLLVLLGLMMIMIPITFILVSLGLISLD